MQDSFPFRAHLVTVLGSTLNRAATSPGVISSGSWPLPLPLAVTAGRCRYWAGVWSALVMTRVSRRLSRSSAAMIWVRWPSRLTATHAEPGSRRSTSHWSAKVGHDRGELDRVVPVLEEFPQGGHGPGGEDEWGRGRGPALRGVAVGGSADLPQAAELAKKGGQAGGGVAGRAGCGVRHCHSPGVGWLVVRGVCGGRGMCARAASSAWRMRVVSSAVPGAVMTVPGGAWNRGKAQKRRV